MALKKGLYGKIRSEAKKIKNNSVTAYIVRPTFTMSGNTEFIAEGKIIVEVYSEEKIKFTVNGMVVTLNGRALEICFYNKHTAKISGFITDIEFENIKKEERYE